MTTGQQIDLMALGGSNHTGNFENGLLPGGRWTDDDWRALRAGQYHESSEIWWEQRGITRKMRGLPALRRAQSAPAL